MGEIDKAKEDAQNQAFNKPRFIVDFAKDTIMGKVTRTGASSWILERFGISRGEGAYNINGTNEVHSFAGDATGAVSDTDYGAYNNDYTVTKDGKAYSFANGGNSPNTFGLTLEGRTGLDIRDWEKNGDVLAVYIQKCEGISNIEFLSFKLVSEGLLVLEVYILLDLKKF